MTKIVKKKLPNGTIPHANLPNPLNKVVMQINGNIKTILEMVETLQTAVIELQKRGR